MQQFREVGNLLDSFVARGIPGCGIIVTQNGNEVYRYEAGYGDREHLVPYSMNNVINGWSVSKVVTAVAAMQLLERGKILLSDELSGYLPEYADMTVRRMIDGREEIVPAQNAITLRHLLTMCAGFDYNIGAPSVSETVKANPACTTRDVIGALAREPLRFDPGEHWMYGLSHDVLAAVIEVVSGRRFSDYVKENIFGPVGLELSSFRRSDELVAKLSPQYLYNVGEGYAELQPKEAFHLSPCPGYESGGAGLITTGEEYVAFLTALACGGKTKRGERILTRASMQLMATNCLNETQLRDFNWPAFRGYGYGLGVRALMDRTRSGALSADGEFGWGGAAGCYSLVDQKNGIAIMYSQHMRNSMEPYTHPRLRNAVYAALER